MPAHVIVSAGGTLVLDPTPAQFSLGLGATGPDNMEYLRVTY